MNDNGEYAREQIVAERYREYSETFIRACHTKDVTRLRPYSHVPSMTVAGGRVHVVLTEAQSDERWARVFSSWPKDYRTSILNAVDVTLMSSTGAFVSADISRFNQNDEEYERVWCSYIFVKADQDWRISATITHDPGQTPHTVRT